jgi:hypothetical protein
MESIIVIVASWIVVAGLFIASASATGRALERRGAKALGLFGKSTTSEIISKAFRIEENALKRMAKYEIDPKLSFNCPEMNDSSHPLTSDCITALQKLSNEKKSLDSYVSRTAANEILTLANDFSYKVNQAELPLIKRMLASEILSPIERSTYESQLKQIKNESPPELIESQRNETSGLVIDEMHISNLESSSSIGLSIGELSVKGLSWSPSNTTTMNEAFKDWRPSSIAK